MAKKKDPIYELTPKGLLDTDAYDSLVLYMMRSGYNGIALDKADLQFIKLEKEKK
jgi:hypothetical protein